MKLLILILILAPANVFLMWSSNEPSAETSEARKALYCAPSFDPSKLNADNAPIFDGLGNLHFKISTASAKAQRYFNQGLTLVYAFNHGEAGRSFKAAIALDSTCAMAWWGLAMVLGPNYNAPLNPSGLAEINDAIDHAIKYSGNASEKEKLLIGAIRARFPAQEVKDMSEYNAAYTAAMKVASTQFPNDINIKTIYADAMMNEHPWDLWLRDGSPKPWTPAIISTLEETLASDPNHPGANHMYIHATEASAAPGKAIPSADRLRDLLPSAGHLVHMPAHIYIRTGDYHKGVVATEKANEADSSYIAQCKIEGAYPMMYYPHNIHFLAACAYLEGNSRKAIDAAWSVARHADKKYINENAAIQHYSIIPYYVLVQTGKWDEILALPKPDESLKYPVAIWHYARGMAYSASNDLSKAAEELDILKAINKDEALPKLLIWDINSAAQLTDIATNVLSGELNTRSGNYDVALSSLQHAVNVEDSLMYQEPPDWFFSTRHSLGHTLLQAKRFAEAEKVYQEDMRTYPENGWALMGLHRSLSAQGKTAEAASVLKRFNKAWKHADMKITSSRIY
jgi:tetratricopeptide (TPR) repeat protein